MKIGNHRTFRCLKRAMTVSLIIIMWLTGTVAISSTCDEFEKDAEAFSGVVPRFDENGKVRAMLMYGESSFIAAKRSLIADARRRAELDARRAFAEFLKSGFDADTVSKNLVETQSLTDSDGTVGAAEELTSTLNVMRQNSQATLSGIVKLDECVDVEEKYLLVQLGWKPTLSESAANASQAINKIADNQKTKSNLNNKTPGIEKISLETEGRGANLKSATNDALRSAVSQVFGEKFASQTSVIDSVMSASMTLGDDSYGVAGQKSKSTSAVQSQTSGLISSWTYIEKVEENEGFKVILSVVIPKYKSSMDPAKTKIIVTKPLAGSQSINQDQTFKTFSSKFHSQLEENLGQIKGLNVLDRQYLNLAHEELGLISNSGNMEELAKIGNQAGGDLMLVPVIEKFNYKLDVREIGSQKIERMIYNVTLSTKVIEVATSNIVDAKSFPVRNKKMKHEDPVIEIASFMAKRAVRHLSKSFGGVDSNNYHDSNESKTDMKKVKDSINKTFEEVKNNVDQDW